MWDMSTNGPKVKELIQSKPVPVDIKVYEESRQRMPEGDYPCKTNNGGCSHLCLLAPGEPGILFIINILTVPHIFTHAMLKSSLC